jgi:hypothetical protein
MLPKLVPIPDPGLVERFTLVKSAKPVGVMNADPKAQESGAVAAGAAGLSGRMNSGAGVAGEALAVVNETVRVEALWFATTPRSIFVSSWIWVSCAATFSCNWRTRSCSGTCAKAAVAMMKARNLFMLRLSTALRFSCEECFAEEARTG